MTGAALLPIGTTLQRPTPVAGMLRMNTTLNPDSLEVYDGTATAWKQLAYVADLGTLSSYTATNGAVLPAAGIYETITIPAGVTVTVPATCRIYARTSITIDGTVNGVGLGAPGGANVGAAGSGTGASGASRGFGLGAPAGGATTPSYGFNTQYVGSGGSGGAVTFVGGGGTNGAGGNSGGSIIFECQGPITVDAAAVINMNGQAGQTFVGIIPGTTGIELAGSGGGSGGLIALQSGTSLSIAAGASLSVNGGNGANANWSGSITAAGGGGGGGGGYIVLNSPLTTNSGSLSLTGGTGGLSVNAGNNTGGSAGGSFGGTGGNGSSSSASGGNGSSGQTLLNVIF